MVPRTSLHLYFSLILLLTSVFIGAFQTRSDVKSRQKRKIIFPVGSSFMQMVVGVGLPFEVNKQSVTIGPFMKSLYRLPTNSTDFTQPSLDIAVDEVRKKRSSRWNFYAALSSTAEDLGFGGKACVLKAICDAAEVPFSEKAGIIGEMFHVIFTPSTSTEDVNSHLDYEYHAAERLGKDRENCQALFPECRINLMERFTQVLTHLEGY